MRNFTVITMQKQFGGKGGVMHDRRAARGGSKNEQAELLKEYEEEKLKLWDASVIWFNAPGS